jgi:hypothetical protein
VSYLKLGIPHTKPSGARGAAAGVLRSLASAQLQRSACNVLRGDSGSGACARRFRGASSPGAAALDGSQSSKEVEQML